MINPVKCERHLDKKIRIQCVKQSSSYHLAQVIWILSFFLSFHTNLKLPKQADGLFLFAYEILLLTERPGRFILMFKRLKVCSQILPNSLKNILCQVEVINL